MRLKLQSQRTNQGGAQHGRQFTTGELNVGPRKPSSFPTLMPERPLNFLANSQLSALNRTGVGGRSAPLLTALFGLRLCLEAAFVSSVSLQFLYQLWLLTKHLQAFLETSHLFFDSFTW